ncbi:hypothetical protein B0H14DRAFT_2599698 [Mycena olivaceomarginata]|nr:hypothetical protein B0H14DRAFT_2599698 [Mycena olivaceomarginata]
MVIGRGIATEPGLEGNAIEAATMTNMDKIEKGHSQRRLPAGSWATLKSGADAPPRALRGRGSWMRVSEGMREAQHGVWYARSWVHTGHCIALVSWLAYALVDTRAVCED